MTDAKATKWLCVGILAAICLNGIWGVVDRNAQSESQDIKNARYENGLTMLRVQTKFLKEMLGDPLYGEIMKKVKESEDVRGNHAPSSDANR